MARLEQTRRGLAQSIENDIVDAAPEHDGRFCGHLLPDTIEHMDFNATAESLPRPVAARLAA